MTAEFRQIINGAEVEGCGDLLRSTNPADPAELVSAGNVADSVQVADAVRAARDSAREWAHESMARRCAVLTRAADLLEKRVEDIGRLLTLEQGKTLGEAVAEARRSAQIFRYHAEEADRAEGEHYHSPRSGERIMVVRKPLGVVALITPWNFPFAIPAWKLAPALVHGNTVVWKPASLVPQLSFTLGQILMEAGIPDGVLNVVITPGHLGQKIVEDPDVDALSFTGSTAVGRGLVATCAKLGKPVQAEMGGQNAAVVLADANLSAAADAVLAGAMQSTGQKCTATSRVIVESSIATEFTALLAERVERLQVGDGLHEQVDVGPVASQSSKADVDAAIAASVDAGGKVVARAGSVVLGGGPGGHFVQPVLLTLSARDVPAWRDEIFGPVLALVQARDANEAFDLANDSVYGLSGAVFTSSMANALRAMEQIDVGVLHINSESTGADPHVPFGGSGASGYGPKEQGQAAKDFFTKTMTVYLAG